MEASQELIYIDENGHIENDLWLLETASTCQALDRAGVTLREGLELMFQMDEQLCAGVVHWDARFGQWVAELTFIDFIDP